jgi:hypothetical protein
MFDRKTEQNTPFQTWPTKSLLVLPCMSASKMCAYPWFSSANCYSPSCVFIHQNPIFSNCGELSPEMLLEITQHVWMRNKVLHYHFKLYHFLKLPRMWKSFQKINIFVNILDGQTCISLESQHICVSGFAFVFSYLYLGYLYFMLQNLSQEHNQLQFTLLHLWRVTSSVKGEG